MCVRHSVVSDSLQPHGLQPARLFCPWDFPGKNTGVSCHFLQGIFSTQGSNSCVLHQQSGSLPLHHQGSLLKHMLAGKQVCISNDHFVFIRTCYFFSYLCCSRDIQRGRVKYIEEYISDLHFKKVPSRNKDDLGNLEIWILVRKLVKELPWWANGQDAMLPIQEV